MAEIKWLDEQKAVLETSGKNQLVSASAGSGKTTVMIEKIARMLLSKQEKLDIDEILVLTFTKSAAAEMKQRLFEKLVDAAQFDATVQEKIDGLANANISTIHAFCQKLLAKYFYVLNINPAFKVLDEGACLYYKSKAFDAAFEGLRETNLEQWNLLVQVYGSNRNENKIKNIMFELESFLQSIENSKEFLQKKAKHFFVHPEQAWQLLNQRLCKDVDLLISRLQPFVEHAFEHGFEKAGNYFLLLLEALKAIRKDSDLFYNSHKLSLVLFENIKGANDGDEEQQAKNFEMRDFVKAQVEKWKEMLPTDKESEQAKTTQMLALVDALIALYAAFNAEYETIKASKHGYDFSDLEKKSLQLLKNKEVRDGVLKQYKYVFIDEYQDINPVQEQLLLLVSNQTNRFMVGDSKQSIYAFRNSDPKIILEKGEQYANSDDGVLQHLNSNFRSNPPILHFVNMLFSFAMTVETTGVNYAPNSCFVPMASFEQNQTPIVQVLIANPPQKEKKVAQVSGVYSVKQAIKTSEEPEDNIELEARMLASKILALKNQELYDAKQKSWRLTQFGDFTILLRDRTHMFALQEALKKLNVPAVAISKPKLFESVYALQMLELLKLVSNFYQDESLVNVLLSPFGGFCEQDLANIRRNAKDKKYFHECFFAVLQNEPSELQAKCAQFYALVLSLKQAAMRNGITDMLLQAIKTREYELFVLHATDGDESELHLVRRFAEFFKQSPFHFALDEFLDYAEKNSEKLQSWVMFETNTSFVTITTIHASKGLEFPIVLLPFCAQPICKPPRGAPDILLSSEYGMAVKHFELEERTTNHLALWTLIEFEKKQTEFAEELRIWYVALTRAKNYMVLSGVIEQKKLQQATTFMHAWKHDSILELLVKSLPKNKQSEWMEQEYLRIANDQLNLEIAFGENLVQETPKEIEVNALTPAQKAELEQKLLEVMKENVVPKVYLKNSVSSIVLDGEEQFFTKQDIDEDVVSFAELGTAFHYVFEILDYTLPITAQSVKELCEKLDWNQIYHRDIEHLIDYEKVASCANLLKPYLENKQIAKEKKFMMRMRANEVFDVPHDDMVLVQGVIDLIAVGDDEVFLFDFKLTKSKNIDRIKQKYEKQLQLYQKAIEHALQKKVTQSFLVLIETEQLISMTN